MLLKKPCSACGEIHEIDEIYQDFLGWHTTCKKTNNVFSVDIQDYVVSNGTKIKVFYNKMPRNEYWIGEIIGNNLVEIDEFEDLLYLIFNKKEKCLVECFRNDFEIIDNKGE